MTVGGTSLAARNLISGNTDGRGIVTNGNITIEGNYIGTNSSGTAAIPNSYGIYANSATTGAIGGAAPGAGNLISGNGIGIGLHLSIGFTIQGNFIGTQADGTSPLGNPAIGGGVDEEDASNIRVGGTASAGRLADGLQRRPVGRAGGRIDVL